MGRGRAKAKQTKVARELKYHTLETDFDALQRELGGGSEPVGGARDRPVDHAVDGAVGADDDLDDDADDRWSGYVDEDEDEPVSRRA